MRLLGRFLEFLLQRALDRRRLRRCFPWAGVGGHRDCVLRDAGGGRRLLLKLRGSSHVHRMYMEEAGRFVPLISDFSIQPGCLTRAAS